MFRKQLVKTLSIVMSAVLLFSSVDLTAAAAGSTVYAVETLTDAEKL